MVAVTCGRGDVWSQDVWSRGRMVAGAWPMGLGLGLGLRLGLEQGG